MSSIERAEHELSSRERSILQAIVHNFILDATPVGSRNLSKWLQQELNLSPASIRNAMADLEEMGFIEQPHTSAGRVPTDKGYRYYVDSLMGVEELSREEVRAIEGNIYAASQETLLRDASKILGSLSHYLSVVRMPQILRSIVTKIELVRLSSSRLLVVLALSSDIVRTLSLEARFEIDLAHLDSLQRLLNERLSGRDLSVIRESLSAAARDASADHHALLRLFIDSAEKLFTREVAPGAGALLIAGAQNLFDYPEFVSAERFRTIIELMENEEVVVHLLDNSSPEEGTVRVAIGSEIAAPAQAPVLAEYSLLTTKYRFASAEAVGTIGLIGPRRMNYSRMISIMQHVAQALSQKI